jgi:Replication-relaxation
VAGRRRRLPSRHGPQVTDRDFEILAWIGRHGVVTPAQVARHSFTRDDGDVGLWAAYRRLRKLEELTLIRHDRTFWREASVVRLTGAGARLVDIDVGPARLVLAEVRHTLAVVDLVEALLTSSPDGTVVRTERELRIERRRELMAGTRKPGRGRVPDAVFIHPRGPKVAIELDLTPKRTRDLERILTAYLQEPYDRIVWYVLPRQEGRTKMIVRQQLAEDYVQVRAWQGTNTTRTA